MPMDLKIYATKDFIQAVKKHRYARVILEKIQLLALNPRHRSLNVHQVRRARKGIWECYASDGDRILYEWRRGALYLWYLGSHALIEKVHCFRFDPAQPFYVFDQHASNTSGEARKKKKNSVKEQKEEYKGQYIFYEIVPECLFSLHQLKRRGEESGSETG